MGDAACADDQKGMQQTIDPPTPSPASPPSQPPTDPTQAAEQAPPESSQTVWYRGDGEYHELRVGAGPELMRGMLFGLVASLLTLGLVCGIVWYAASVVATNGPPRELANWEAAALLDRQLGALAPASGKFLAADLHAADRLEHGGAGRTYYRFAIAPEQVDAYGEHLLSTWKKQSGHRTLEHTSFDGGGLAMPRWWDGQQIGGSRRIGLQLQDGTVVVRAALTPQGVVFLQVQHDPSH